jgi:hypothetical protein
MVLMGKTTLCFEECAPNCPNTPYAPFFAVLLRVLLLVHLTAVLIGCWLEVICQVQERVRSAVIDVV